MRFLYVVLLCLLLLSISFTAEAQSSCPVRSIKVISANTNGVITDTAGEVNRACEALIEVQNNRSYWANLKITPIGNGVEVLPSDIYATTLMGYQVLPPAGVVFLKVRFTNPGQTVIVLEDVTPAAGDGAREMNLTQSLLDLVSLLRIADVDFGTDFLLEYYPTLKNAVLYPRDLPPVTSPVGVRVELVLQRQPEPDNLGFCADDVNYTPAAIVQSPLELQVHWQRPSD